MAKKEVELPDDEEHHVLYISPGEIPSGNGRTYGWKHAKDEDDKEDLIKQGYSMTLPEAYEKAGRPLTRREWASAHPGKKDKDGKATDKGGKAADEGERDPISGELEPVEAATLKDVQNALKKLKEAKDAKAVAAVLKPFKVKAATELEESQYPAVIVAVEKAAAE